ncbi:protein of unknown function [Burkholderia multivorans]
MLICRRQRDLQAQLSYQPRHGGLDLLVDSTGVKFLGEGEWKTQKHGADYRRQWRKVHLAVDANTLEIRGIGSPAMRWAMPRCGPSCSNKFRPTNR